MFHIDVSVPSKNLIYAFGTWQSFVLVLDSDTADSTLTYAERNEVESMLSEASSAVPFGANKIKSQLRGISAFLGLWVGWIIALDSACDALPERLWYGTAIAVGQVCRLPRPPHRRRRSFRVLH